MPDANKPGDPALPTDASGLRALVGRAQKGDEATVPALRRLLAEPSAIALLGGELARQAERSFVAALAGENLALRESLARKLELLRAELGGADPTPVERLLVERAVACWLQVQDAAIRYAQSQGNLSIKQADYHQRRMDAAHRRYLAALKALAVVRKLAAQVLQVNFAKRQVNVAAPVP